MVFYNNIEHPEYTSSPFLVKVGDMTLSYMDPEAFPFIVTEDRGVIFGMRGQEHNEAKARYGNVKSRLEGRYWINEKVISVWDFPYSYNGDYQKYLSMVNDAMRRRLGINTSNVRIFFECSYGETPDERRYNMFIVEVTLPEFLSLNIGGQDMHEYFWNLMQRQKVQKQPEPEPEQTYNGMSSRNLWRHYEMMENVKLNKDSLKMIVENVIKELHQNQQLMLPFDDNSEPYNYMHFMEWLEGIGTYGKLPAQPNGMKEILNNTDILRSAGLSSFYFGPGDEWDYEGYLWFLQDFVKENSESVLADGTTPEDICDNIGTIEETVEYLSPQGVELWNKVINEKGYEILSWWAEHYLTFNEEGLIYCERMIGIQKPLDRYYDEKYDVDYYQVLSHNYNGIGEYWSYAKGGGQIYFENGYNQVDALIKGWVSPKDVNWGASICLESMDEQELRLEYFGTVQVDSIEFDMPDENGNYKKYNMPLKGSILIKI